MELSLLYQDISHGFDVSLSIVRCTSSNSVVPTCVGIVSVSSRPKPNSGITVTTVSFVISKDTDSCLSMGVGLGARRIEPLLVAIGLQGSLRANQLLPRVTTQ